MGKLHFYKNLLAFKFRCIKEEKNWYLKKRQKIKIGETTLEIHLFVIFSEVVDFSQMLALNFLWFTLVSLQLNSTQQNLESIFILANTTQSQKDNKHTQGTEQ